MFTTTITTALLTTLTLTYAAPYVRAPPFARDSTACPLSSQFTLTLSVPNQPQLALVAEHSSAGTSSLNFERPSAYSGTPVCISDSRLVFALPNTDEPATAVFAYPDYTPGARNAVTAGSGLEGTQAFSVAGGKLVVDSHPGQGLLACNSTVDAEEVFALFYGTAVGGEGQAPEGCVWATLVQNFNVEGGATGPSP